MVSSSAEGWSVLFEAKNMHATVHFDHNCFQMTKWYFICLIFKQGQKLAVQKLRKDAIQFVLYTKHPFNMAPTAENKKRLCLVPTYKHLLVFACYFNLQKKCTFIYNCKLHYWTVPVGIK